MGELEYLLSEVQNLNYPSAMKKVVGKIEGVAFFPGGKGTFDNSLTVSDKRIMVLGQDFDTETNYDTALHNGQESINGNATWRNLLAFLKEVAIQPETCFFTNAIMGVRKEGKSTGESPAFRHPEFIKECQELFLKQLETQQPELVLVLGKMTGEFLAGLSEELRPWKKLKSIEAIDAAGHQIKEKVHFSNGVTTTLLLLTHPSFRPANVRRRTFDGSSGSPAEIRMIEYVLGTQVHS